MHAARSCWTIRLYCRPCTDDDKLFFLGKWWQTVSRMHALWRTICWHGPVASFLRFFSELMNLYTSLAGSFLLSSSIHFEGPYMLLTWSSGIFSKVLQWIDEPNTRPLFQNVVSSIIWQVLFCSVRANTLSQKLDVACGTVLRTKILFRSWFSHRRLSSLACYNIHDFK
jgi:hypothetical protein